MTTSLALLFVGMVVGLAVWGAALHGQPDAPPSRDGLYHGFFVERIAETDSVDLSRVLVTDPVTEDVAASFYPLALHDAVALEHRLSGLDIGLLLSAWMAVSAAVFLPAGLFVLVRRLVPDRPLAAGFTALIVPFVAMFPYRPAAWSGITLIVGLALTPVVLVLAAAAADADAPRPEVVGPVAVAVTGVISTHTSQLALIVVVLAVIEGEALWSARHQFAVMRRRAISLLWVTGVTVVLYLPSLLKLRSAASERMAFAETGYLRFPEAIGALLDLSFAMPGSQGALGVLVVIGLCLAARHRTLGSWGICLGLTVVLFLATVVTGGFWHRFRPLTRPWYSSSWRTSYQVALVAVVFAGYALAVGASALAALLRRARPRLGAAGPLVVAGVLVGLGSATLVQQPVDVVRHGYEANARTTTSMLHAFDYLAGHTEPDEAILNEERDGSAWMYAASGLHPLLAVYQYVATEQTLDRIYLATHIADVRDDERVRALVERWSIRFVVVSDTGFVDEPPRVAAADLAGNPAFGEVFAEGGIHVFQLQG